MSLSSMYPPEANVSEQSRLEIEAKLAGMGNIHGRQISPEQKAKKLREACEGFESIFIQKMWQEMRNTVPKGGLLHSREEGFWQDMYDQELAKSMAKTGGIGLADMMYEQLSRTLANVSKTTAGQGGYAVFTPAAAPLVAQPGEDLLADPQDKAAKSGIAPVSSIYDGEAPQTGSYGPEEKHEEPAERGGLANDLETQNLAALQNNVARPVQAPAPVEKVKITRTVQSQGKSSTHKTRGLNQNSALDLAYLARRDAGDKIGPGAVRPALHHAKRKESENAPSNENTERTTNQGFSQNGNLQPGSVEGLRAAIDQARANTGAINQQAGPSLASIVASVKAQNAVNSAQSARDAVAAQTAQDNAEALKEETGNKITKVTYTTNIPKSNTRSSKKSGQDAIRLLNVDNVGVNSKAGQGIAAYHAQQEAAANGTSQQAAQSMPISPLTALSNQNAADNAASSFAIPPLKSQI